MTSPTKFGVGSGIPGKGERSRGQAQGEVVMQRWTGRGHRLAVVCAISVATFLGSPAQQAFADGALDPVASAPADPVIDAADTDLSVSEPVQTAAEATEPLVETAPAVAETTVDTAPAVAETTADTAPAVAETTADTAPAVAETTAGTAPAAETTEAVVETTADTTQAVAETTADTTQAVAETTADT